MTRGVTDQRGTIRAATEIAAGVRLLEIVPVCGVTAYPLGSHLDVAVRIDGASDRRSYSLVGPTPVDGAYRIAVKRLARSRGGSAYMHALGVGSQITFSPPVSHFTLTDGSPEYLLIAGGIGITALVGMAEELDRRGHNLRLLYAGRSRSHLAFADQLGELLGERLEVFVSSEGDRLDVRREIAGLHAGGELYVCGPLRMLEAARDAWTADGRAPERLRFETFGSSGRFDTSAFTVRLRDHDDREIAVPDDRTMLESMLEHGVDLVWDCRRGECGLCQVDVLEVDGRLDHRDVFLSDAEHRQGRKLVTCVSRAVGGSVTVDTGLRR